MSYTVRASGVGSASISMGSGSADGTPATATWSSVTHPVVKTSSVRSGSSGCDG